MFCIVPIVKQQPHSFSRARVGHTVVHQKHQTGIWGVEQPHFQVEGFPKQHLQGLVILRVVAGVLGVWDERRCVSVVWIEGDYVLNYISSTWSFSYCRILSNRIEQKYCIWLDLLFDYHQLNPSWLAGSCTHYASRESLQHLIIIF